MGTEMADNETLPKALQDLGNWLKRGDCNRKEVTNFYTALHHAITHAKYVCERESCCCFLGDLCGRPTRGLGRHTWWRGAKWGR